MSLIIAIDGPAASGKGTLARNIAEKLRLAHMDTGALYRAVAHMVLMAGYDPEDEEQAVIAAHSVQTHFTLEMLTNPLLKEDEVGSAASKVAAFDEVRNILKDLQKSFAKNPPPEFRGSILDGRDIGTVICPDADVKLYIIADTEIRAQRRYKELQSAGIASTYEAVLTDMRERDERDSNRSTAPLKPAEDALTLDTSELGADEALEQALALIDKKLSDNA